MSKRERGSRAENQAVTWLRQKGYLILSRNIRLFGTEIDILARSTYFDELCYTFFEVKNMKKANYLAGYPPLSQAQQARYQRAIEHFQAGRLEPINVNMGLLVFDEMGKLLLAEPIIQRF